MTDIQMYNLGCFSCGCFSKEPHKNRVQTARFGEALVEKLARTKKKIQEPSMFTCLGAFLSSSRGRENMENT